MDMQYVGQWWTVNIVLMHREILNITDPNIKVDHINNNKLCNERTNLRKCTMIQNMRNMKISGGGTSKYKGVSWHRRKGKWTAQIKVNYKKIHLGYFTDERDAAIVYNKKAIELFGEFARINELV